MANIPGFSGYNQWPQLEAENDFKATGGRGKETPGTTGGGGGTSAPDMVNLRNQAYEATKAYYEKIATQAKGDYDTAVKLMTADYQQGVRQAQEKNAYEVKYGTDDLTNALATLGINFGQENESLVDSLNKRGMAVYQNNPDGTPNVVNPTPLNPTDDTTNFTWSNNLQNYNNPNSANLGRGGYELNQLQQSQGLRAEAIQRAKMQPLENSAINLKQYTNPSQGFDSNNPGAFTGDVSKLGSAESGLLSNQTSALQGYRNKTQQLAQDRSQEISSIANGAASIGQRSIDQNLVNQYQKELNTDFVNGVGV